MTLPPIMYMMPTDSEVVTLSRRSGAGSDPVGSQPMKRISVVELRQELADILDRAEYLGERTVIHRRDKDAAAIIAIEDLNLLERLIREEEDRLDIAAAQSARKENDYIPYEEFRTEVGMKNE
jgi:PHD/YefM family antitoxin component YafN of YafNO toxin-antitoxin module